MKLIGEIRKNKLVRLALYGLGLTVSFVLFDRLLFFCFREGAARYYSSLHNDKLAWASPVGNGKGQILVLGTSRANLGFDADVLSSVLKEKIYEEAHIGDFPQYNYYFYRKYREKFGTPSLVIYGVDYFIFDKESSDSRLDRLEITAPWVKASPAQAVNPASPSLSRVSQLYHFKPKIDELFADLWSLGRNVEKEDEPPDDLLLAENVKPKALKEPQNDMPGTLSDKKPRTWGKRRYKPFPGKEGSFFLRLLEDLEKDGVPVCLVFIPDYKATNKTNFQQDKFKDDIRRLAAVRKKTWVLDFNLPEMFNLDDPQLFKNIGSGIVNCHLSKTGARLFSQKIAPDIQRILESGTASREGERIDAP